MSHKGRVWYIGDFNNAVNDFLAWDEDNIPRFDPDSDFLVGFWVYIDGERCQKNLARLPSYNAIKILQENQKKLGLCFSVYVQESPGAKIVPWVGDVSTKKKKTKKVCKK